MDFSRKKGATDVSRRDIIVGVAALGVASTARAAAEQAVTPEMFGAKGDGHTNDTEAFAAMSAHVNARGGGTIVLRRVTYIVGQQHRAPGGRQHAFKAASIMRLSHCKLPVVIHGNGATLRMAPGLRYGRFDPKSGAALPDPSKREFGNEAMLPFGMININGCFGSIEISDLELDGNLPALLVGGKSNRSSWNSGGSGLWLVGNRGPERLTRIHSHHHATDGMILKPAVDRSGSTIVVDSLYDYNGRQGCSITGGRNIAFQRCKFLRTGRAVLHHPPGDGVDIEAEWPIRNVTFNQCEFSDNSGFGVGVGKQTNAAGVSFTDCKFIGTTNWAAWLDRPGMRARDCVFIGAIIHAYGDPDARQAAQFLQCTFTDEAALSPTREVFLGRGGPKWIAVLKDGRNVLFSKCRFRLVGDGLLPRSIRDVIYADCDMAQRSPKLSSPVGTYIGINTIHGNANLQGSVIRGKVTLNGRSLVGG